MFCEKCGAKIEEGSRFCESCGTPVTQQEVKTEEPKKKFVAPSVENDETIDYSFNNNSTVSAVPSKPMSKKTKIICGAVIAVVAVCAISYNLVGNLFKPEKFAEDYFEKLQAGEFAEVYKYLDVDETTFVNEANFVKIMQAEREEYNQFEDLVNFVVKEDKELNSEDPLMKHYNIKYSKKGSSSQEMVPLTLIKQSSKKMLFFDDYKVADDNLIAKDFIISVPKSGKVYVDDIEMTEEYLEANQDETRLYYSIPEVFQGMHNVKITSPISDDIVRDIDVTYDNYEYRIDYFTLSEAIKEETTNKSKEFVEKFIVDTINNKKFDDLKDYVTEEYLEVAQGLVDDFISSAAENDEDEDGIKNVKISNVEPNEFVSNGYSNTLRINFDYEYEYIYEDWWDDEFEIREYSNDGYVNFTYTVVDDKVLISNIYYNFYLR